jgi:hypothetical protein
MKVANPNDFVVRGDKIKLVMKRAKCQNVYEDIDF